MKQGSGELVELYLENGQTGAKLRCSQILIPAAGQYLLAYDPASDSSLPAPVFNAGTVPSGFLIPPPIPSTWTIGTILNLRGPLGHGFSMPVTARHVALVALEETPARLKPLINNALAQSAAVVLMTEHNVPDLPPEVEVQSLAELAEVVDWADYLAVDTARESLPALWSLLSDREQKNFPADAQALIYTPMPCGGMADCGVCAVHVRRGWNMACKDGPVFNLRDLK